MSQLSATAPKAPRRVRGAVLAATAGLALAISGCSAGQITQTAEQRPLADGANYESGDIQILDAAIEPPGAEGWEAGDEVDLTMYVLNNGTESDEITSITVDGVEVALNSTESSVGDSSSAATSGAPAATSSAPAAESTSAAAGTEAAPTTDAEASVDFVPLTLLPGVLAAIGPEGESVASVEITEGPLYTAEKLPIEITFANAGTLSFQIPVGSSDDEVERDPSATVDLHEEEEESEE